MNQVEKIKRDNLVCRHDELLRMYTHFSMRCGELNHYAGVYLMNDEILKRLKELEKKIEEIESHECAE